MELRSPSIKSMYSMQIIRDVCHEDVLMLSWRRWTDKDVLTLKTLEFVKKNKLKIFWLNNSYILSPLAWQTTVLPHSKVWVNGKSSKHTHVRCLCKWIQSGCQKVKKYLKKWLSYEYRREKTVMFRFREWLMIAASAGL